MKPSLILRLLVLATSLAAAAVASAQTLYVPGSVGSSTTGNVGIGVSNPAYKLTVNAAVGDGVQIGSGSNPVLKILSYWGTSLADVPGTTGGMQLIGPANAHVVLDIPGNDGHDGFYVRVPTTLVTNPTVDKTAFVVKASGYVGIGNSAPLSLLDVSKNGGNAVLRLNNSGNGNWSGIDFVRERQAGPNVHGGSIFISSNTENNNALLYLQAQTASATAGYTGSLGANNGVRLVLRGGTGAATFDYGNVGIGPTIPAGKLHVEVPDSFSPLIAERTGANAVRFEVKVGGNNLGLYQKGNASNDGWISGVQGGVGYKISNSGGFGTNDYLTILNTSGNVGIGTTNPTQKLSVNGTIRAREVIIESTGWPDYVFAADYPLPSLTEVATHIKTEGHLPGVPSAATVADRGVPVGEMQQTLLRKIEELTLYVIAQEQRLAAQEAELRELKSALSNSSPTTSRGH